MSKELLDSKVMKLEQSNLELKTEIAELKKICDNLLERLVRLEEGAGTHGVYLDGVEDYYRDSILKTLNSGKR